MASRVSIQDQLLDAVDEYRAKGWHPVPLPRGKKWPPPKGYTGADGTKPRNADYRHWERQGTWGNLALVMPENVIGYDVDVYHGGQLPADLPVTVRSTSRDDGSGIYLFAIQADTRLRGDDGPGVEIIQWFHRYCVAWPSLHPEGGVYDWYWPNDDLAAIPDVDKLPQLPAKHLTRLQETRRPVRKGDGFDGGWLEWCEQLPGGRMSPRVRQVLREFDREMVSGACRHGAMVLATGRLVGLGRRDRMHRPERGVGEGMDHVIDTYLASVAVERDRDPQGELERAIQGAVEKFGGKGRR